MLNNLLRNLDAAPLREGLAILPGVGVGGDFDLSNSNAVLGLDPDPDAEFDFGYANPAGIPPYKSVNRGESIRGAIITVVGPERGTKPAGSWLLFGMNGVPR